MDVSRQKKATVPVIPLIKRTQVEFPLSDCPVEIIIGQRRIAPRINRAKAICTIPMDGDINFIKMSVTAKKKADSIISVNPFSKNKLFIFVPLLFSIIGL